MKITFYGGARDVTGSNFLVEAETGETFIVDCGLFQGSRAVERLNDTAFLYDVDDVDFVILTHAHIDHSGRLPKLVKDGYRHPVYMTPATRDLIEIMLADSAHIQESDTRWENRRRRRAGQAPVEPLYTQVEVEKLLPLVKTHYYDEIFQPTENIRIRFRDAGHILGSAIVEIWAKEGDRTEKIVFTGDMGMKGRAIIKDPTYIENADTLVMESTYGNTTHGSYDDSLETLMTTINRVTGRGGTVVIPSFAIGRTQELIYKMNMYYEYHDVPEKHRIPIYIDSPLARQATSVFMKNTDVMDDEAKSLIRQGDNIFRFANLRYTESVDESKALNRDRSPKVIISASGMATGGRVRHHLKHTLWDAKNAVIFVGYQAEGTLGRLLVDGVDRVKLMGEHIQVRAEILRMEGLSAHADRPTLLDWLDHFEHRPKEIILVHGEPDEMEPLAEAITSRYDTRVYMPKAKSSLVVTPGAEGRRFDYASTMPEQRRAALEGSMEEVRSLMDALVDREMDLEGLALDETRFGELQRTVNELRGKLMDYNMQTGA